MATPTTSFRLPAETLDRLRALALPGESLSGVIVRAALALEAAPALAPPTDTPEDLDALAARVSRLEACIAPVAQASDNRVTPATHLQHDQEQPVLQAAPMGSTSAAVHDVLLAALHQGLAASHPPPPGRPIYPPEVRRMALDMADQGEPPVKIRRAIEEACGFEPGSKNWSKVVRAWRKAAESSF